MNGRGVAKNAAVVAFMTFISRIGGLVREILMAHYFGAGLAKSAFDVAYRIPNLLRRLFGEGALSAALIPIYTETAERRGRKEADAMASAVLGIAMAILSAIAVAGIALAWAAARFLPLGGKWAAIMPLLEIMMPYAPLICLAALIMGVLNSLKSFAMSALAPAFQNLCCIAVLALVCPFLPAEGSLRIKAVSWSIVASGVVQVAVQLPELRRHGVPLALTIPRHLPENVRRVFRLAIPMALSAGVVQVNVCLDSVLAMHASEWGPSALGYADRIVYLPLAIFGTAFSTVLLPTLSSLAAVRDFREFAGAFTRSIRNGIVVMAPATAALIVLAGPVVSLIYESGRFGLESTVRTAVALMAYAAGLVPAGVHKMAVTAFHARKDVRTPVVVGTWSVALNLAMNLFFIWVLPPDFKPVGIAIATSISSLIASTWLLALLSRKEEGGARLFSMPPVAWLAVKAFLAAAMMAFVARRVADTVWPWLSAIGMGEMSKPALLIVLTAATAVGGLVYFAIMRMLCPADIRELASDIVARGRRRGNAAKGGIC